jgi:hypothetical protein
MKLTVRAGTQINDSGTIHHAGTTFTPVSDPSVVDVWVQSGWATQVTPAHKAVVAHPDTVKPPAKRAPRKRTPAK